MLVCVCVMCSLCNAVICQKKKACISLPAWNAAAASLLMCDSNYVLAFLLKGESDDSILRLAKNDGIVSK